MLKLATLAYVIENVFFPRSDPTFLNIHEFITFELIQKLSFYIQGIENNFQKKLKKNSFFLGAASSFLQFIENDLESVHFATMPTLDVYIRNLWKFIIPFEIDDYTCKYNLLKKNYKTEQ